MYSVTLNIARGVERYTHGENLQHVSHDEVLRASHFEFPPNYSSTECRVTGSNVLQIARSDFRKGLQPSRISTRSEAKSATSGRPWPETNGGALVGPPMAYDRGPRPRKMSGNLRGWKRQS